MSIFVLSFASLRAKNKEDRKVYQENGQLESFFAQYADKTKAEIRELSDSYAETQFFDMVKSKRIIAKNNWKLHIKENGKEKNADPIE